MNIFRKKSGFSPDFLFFSIVSACFKFYNRYHLY
ncbi:hypothetical protein Q757_05145 [Oenococcus alcoholitolerans]|uniref:Lipoprotein n=1 Tax=Oenococcus alcoholitolerans TaxID=931074 RepID=A0ABR4XQN0_9LACO|nr:hypothetical protein Q757_05145 [Oenococcus alcoholitolerans]